jgi:hypothetical protein
LMKAYDYKKLTEIIGVSHTWTFQK